MARYCSYGQKVQKEKVKIRCAKIQWLHRFLLVSQPLIIQYIHSYPQKQSTNLKLMIYVLSIYSTLQSSTVGTQRKAVTPTTKKRPISLVNMGCRSCTLSLYECLKTIRKFPKISPFHLLLTHW